ncbi:hypothetical protein TKK_0015691 [Trichogramma kaykai]
MAVKVLKHLLIKFSPSCISIAKSEEIENTPWDNIEQLLCDELKEVETKLMICTGEIQFIQLTDRQKIIEELRSSKIGGYKGIAKVTRRIKSMYYWPNLKEDNAFLPLEKYNAIRELINPQLDQELLVYANDTEHLDEIVKSIHISQRGNIVIVEITLTTMKTDTPEIYRMTPYRVTQHELHNMSAQQPYPRTNSFLPEAQRRNDEGHVPKHPIRDRIEQHRGNTCITDLPHANTKNNRHIWTPPPNNTQDRLKHHQHRREFNRVY